MFMYVYVLYGGVKTTSAGWQITLSDPGAIVSSI